MRIIIVGAGEVGFHIAQRLSSENKEVLVIDRDASALKRVSEQLDVQFIQGSGSSPKVLEEAGIKGADILLAVTDSDETNLIACFFANSLAPHLTKVARIRNEEYTDYQKALARDILNINMVINPEVETVRSVMHLINTPGVREVNEFAEGRIQLLGIQLDEKSPLAGTGLTDLRDFFGKVNVIIGAIVRDDRLIIPSGADTLKGGDLLYFVCDKNHRNEVLRRFGFPAKPLRAILIIGGGNIGLRLAQALDSKQYNVKLVESDPLRSQYLSAKLDRPVVLLGDGTDQELLEEENIKSMDLVIALTGDDETNVLSCLLSRSLGTRKTIARVNKFPYMPLVQAIGVEHIVSTRLSAINSILHSIRRGKVLSTVSIKGEEAEVMEAVALDKSNIVDRPIKDIDFPSGALILAVLRGEEVIIPTGDFVIHPEDRIIIISTRKNVTHVERQLMVKLEYI
ncbi:Trk system potassium transporter TrkA [Desulfohalovibrio reitneri]|uniref:Trk system potassium transporter TrkA n=1 Tax=Desulfohalovibrio reitneri TaxID=1307759 RepID=UPI0004A78114|nr:Trk system potassium transporter TrkA [Desulfohalovibrio reitneri]